MEHVLLNNDISDRNLTYYDRKTTTTEELYEI